MSYAASPSQQIKPLCLFESLARSQKIKNKLDNAEPLQGLPLKTNPFLNLILTTDLAKQNILKDSESDVV